MYLRFHHVFAKAEKDEVLILEVQDKPLFVSKSFLLTPFPCCTTIEKLNIKETRFSSRFCEIATLDHRVTTVECTVNFSIDNSHKTSVLKAYSFINKKHKNNGQVWSSNDNIHTQYDRAAVSVTGIVGDCLVGQALKLTFKRMAAEKHLLMDIAFDTARKILGENGIVLNSLILDNIALMNVQINCSPSNSLLSID